MTKPMTVAEYRAHAEEKRKDEQTFIETLKSGSVFELRRPNLQVWFMTGRVSQSLLMAGIEAWKKQGKVSDAAQRKPEVIADSAIFFLRLVQYCTVNPHLEEFPDPGKNEIGPETMLDEDFYEIVDWAMSHGGVAGIDGLRSFREGSERGTAGDLPDGPELRGEMVESPAN